MISSEPVNQFEAAARTAKAAKLAAALHKGGVSLDDAKLMDESHWEMLRKGIGINPPSAKTISEALKTLEGLR